MLTKRLLQSAFLKLLKKKPIHTISIRELCQHAGINRTTFYNHYGSQYDLLKDISQRFLDSVSQCLYDADTESQEGIQNRVILVLHYIEDNLEVSTLLLNNSIDPAFAERLFSLQQITDLLKVPCPAVRMSRNGMRRSPLRSTEAINCSGIGSMRLTGYLRKHRRSGCFGLPGGYANRNSNDLRVNKNRIECAPPV
ncbi:MAG: TetR/AcrR family transcriptional regulator [Ruminococcaceae bacterium]|nr:TetR/AcrR family transcriptional regulator [Oscillospiraceae bacterium]